MARTERKVHACGLCRARPTDTTTLPAMPEGKQHADALFATSHRAQDALLLPLPSHPQHRWLKTHATLRSESACANQTHQADASKMMRAEANDSANACGKTNHRNFLRFFSLSGMKCNCSSLASLASHSLLVPTMFCLAAEYALRDSALPIG